MRNLKFNLTLTLVIASFSLAFSQGVAINNDGSSAHGSAMLDVKSTDAGLLIPRMTQAQRNAISSPATGLMIYQTDNTAGFYYNSGTPASPVWEQLLNGDSGWKLNGNSGTTAATEFIGTTDAQDFVSRTNDTERMRITSNGNVLVNTNTALDNTEALEVIVSPTFTTAIGAYGNGGYPIWGQQTSGSADGIWAINSAATGADVGCGLVGISYQTSGAGIWGEGGDYTRGIMGFNNSSSRSAIQAQNTNASGDALYVVNSAANGAANGSAIYATSNQTGGQTIGATLQSTSVYSNSCISSVAGSTGSNGVIGVSSSNTGTGIRGLNSAGNGSAIGYGGFFSSNQIGGAALASCLRGTNYYSNAAISGVTISSVANGIGVIGGCDNTTGVGVQGQSIGTNGIGILGLANQANGSAVNGQNFDAAGTAVIGAGNNQAPSTLVAGSGGAFTGSTIGVYGYAANIALNTWGGYFTNAWGDFAYVGGDLGGTTYKINGIGSVSTIIERADGTKANMFCPETPEILFQDFGSGKLINGKAYIKLDADFTNNIFVSEEHPLRVFVQLEGNCNGVYVTNKSKHGFDVIELQNGNSNVEFSWTVTAVRADTKDENGTITSKHVGVRFPDAPEPLDVNHLQKQTIKKHQKAETTKTLNKKQTIEQNIKQNKASKKKNINQVKEKESQKRK